MMLPDPWRHHRPKPAAHYAGLLADAPRRPLAIFGPRQVGKTHFLTHDLQEAAHGRGWEPVYVDLWGQADPLGAVNTAVAAALRRASLATGRTAVTSVGALGVNVGLAAPAPLAAVTDPAAMLATQFAELLRLQPGKPVLLMLDEAQTLVKPGAGDLAMKAIRALFNGHPGAVLLVFTGSSKPQLMSLVGDHSKTAFKLAAHMDFPVLGQDFIAFVASRYHEITRREVDSTELGWAFEQLLHRPGEMIDFVRFMITEAPGEAVRAALEAFKVKNRPDLGFQQHSTAARRCSRRCCWKWPPATSCSRGRRESASASASHRRLRRRRRRSITGCSSSRPRACWPRARSEGTISSKTNTYASGSTKWRARAPTPRPSRDSLVVIPLKPPATPVVPGHIEVQLQTRHLTRDLALRCASSRAAPLSSRCLVERKY